ncbi:glycoside hydrolase family 25 protein [Reichenbachiella versicolor]|uniref:glycoside hydrolase family 25 protein n=1 Tax=Reichenbachiella versicolor TaxID=1821036 RepID=UPI000D6DE748|nr:GH25 family lysozyme [Reichenbachiella versicolor]
MKKLPNYVLVILIVLLVSALIFALFVRKKDHRNKYLAPTTHSDTDGSVSQNMLHGCDISHWNGQVNWTALKKTDITFLFIKATQGLTYVDPDFEENWTTARNYGFLRGAYHFYQPQNDPQLQAEHFLKTVELEKGDILPVLDIEISNGVSNETLSKDIGIWINTVKDKIGRYPIIYTDLYFWNAHIVDNYSQCPLWLAEWETSGKLYMPKGWVGEDWVFWQYSSTGTLSGIPSSKNRTDMDYFNGSLHALRHYTIR